jgi:SAM-dependent methyltransferase
MNEDLSKIYEIRFSGQEEYRTKVWQVLVREFFSKWISPNARILDLGCGYGEFINNIDSEIRHGMDLNPNAKEHLSDGVIFHKQDCSEDWSLEPNSLDIVFTSNFFEHLPSKLALDQTISNAHAALKPGGLIIAMGPNISVLNGKYWDFWDHRVPLSSQSISELLEIHGFELGKSIDRFLPYNMVRVRRYPLCLLRLYLHLPFVWPLFGKQFLIVAKKK